jgi:hypothetical protein
MVVLYISQNQLLYVLYHIIFHAIFFVPNARPAPVRLSIIMSVEIPVGNYWYIYRGMPPLKRHIISRN